MGNRSFHPKVDSLMAVHPKFIYHSLSLKIGVSMKRQWLGAGGGGGGMGGLVCGGIFFLTYISVGFFFI